MRKRLGIVGKEALGIGEVGRGVGGRDGMVLRICGWNDGESFKLLLEEDTRT